MLLREIIDILDDTTFKKSVNKIENVSFNVEHTKTAWRYGSRK
jgi:hypothetical protein